MLIPAMGFSQVLEDSTIVKLEDSTAVKRDTLILDESAVDNPVFYEAEDSIYSDLRKKQIHLYRNAKVDYGSTHMEAGYIMIDLNKNEVYATYIYDQDSNRIQKPIFKDGGETLEAASIRYNFTTKKGYIEEVKIQQDETFLYMEVAKRHPDDQVHFRRGKFTTCDLEEPHYHFHLSKAVLVPEKRIASGAMNLWIQGVPTPLGLPFALIPQSEDRTHGLIFPELVPISEYGFGFQNLGYYFPINEKLQTTMYAGLYSRGSWSLGNTTDYAKRYKYNGKFIASFQQRKSGFPNNTNANKFQLDWQHRMNPKANPYWQFNSSVRFTSDNNNQNSLDLNNADYFSNTLNSNINLSRLFPGKPVTSGLSIALSQNSLSKNISLSSPKLNLNVSRFFPFKHVGKKANMLSQLGITYGFEAQNKATFKDTLLRDGNYDAIGQQFMNGVSNSITIQSIASMFKNTWKFVPSISYSNYMNFQHTDKYYDSATDQVITDTVAGFDFSQKLSFNASLSSALYSYYKFIGKNETVLRHVLTPKFGLRFSPNLNSPDYYYDAEFNPVAYSTSEQSLYRIGTTKDQALLTYNFSNTFELKQKSKKDTVTGYRKIRIIDAFTINGNYDFMKDSMNFSDVRLNLRISPAKWVNFVASSSLSFYAWDKITGKEFNKAALNHNNQLGRFKTNTFTTTFTLTSKESRQKLDASADKMTQNWNDDYEYFMLHPEHVIRFDIPWKASISHVFSVNQNTNSETFVQEPWRQVHTLLLNGDLSFTKRWKIATTINMDLEDIKITNANFILTRDMHCWRLEFQWRPIGGNKSFLFSIRNTSSLLKDAKINIRRPPAFL